MARHAFALVFVVAFAFLPSRKTCPANEGGTHGPSAWGLLPERLLPLVGDLDVQLELTYAASRPVLRGRVQYTLQVLDAWQGSGRTPRDEALFEAWLRDAIVRSNPGRREPLAPVPSFSRPNEESAHRDDQEHNSAPESTPQAGRATVVSSGQERNDPPIPLALARPMGELKSGFEPQPAAMTPPREPPDPVVGPSALPPADDKWAPAIASDPAAAGAEGKPPAAHSPPQLAELPRPDVTAGPNPKSLDVRPAAIEAGPNDPSSSVAGELKFNLREYTARLAGHRRGLRRVEARLVELNDPTAYEVAGLVAELERLTRQAALLDMYATLLPPDLLAIYGQPASSRGAIDTLGEIIALRRAAVPDGGRGATSGQDEQALDIWGSLTDRIDRLSDAGGQLDATP